jgi:cell division protein FtsA
MAGHPVGNYAVGLDVGTTKVCAIVGTEETAMKGIRILGIGTAPSTGLKKGIVVDIERTVSSIKSAVQKARDETGLGIESAHIGVAGGHVKGFYGYGAIGVKNREIREEDVERLIDSVGAMYIPVDREVLHIIPSGFKIDGHNGIRDPVGMYGKRLEAQIHIITGAVTSVQNLLKCCELAGIGVNDIVLEPLASSEAVLREEERQRGVALMDIGGGTTDIAVYRGGILKHTSVLAIGGNHITNDIAVGLGISFDEAERIKKQYGFALRGMTEVEPPHQRIIDVAVTSSRTKRISQDVIAGIIQERCEELIRLVKREIEVNSGTPLGTSVVLTGGTSLLRGIRELSEDIIGLPVRTGIPERIIGTGLVESPIYATGVGLVNYGLCYSTQPELGHLRVIERMRSWVNSLFK